MKVRRNLARRLVAAGSRTRARADRMACLLGQQRSGRVVKVLPLSGSIFAAGLIDACVAAWEATA